MTQDKKNQYVKNLKLELKQDMRNLEIELNIKIKNFEDKWEKDFYKVDISAIDLLHPAYDKNRGGHIQLLSWTTYPNPNKNNEY